MKSSDMEKRIIGCIKEHGLHGASSTEISESVGINRHTLAKYLNVLNAEGKIGFKRAGMGKIWFIEKSPLHGVSNGSKDIADTGLKTTLGHILSTMPDGIVVENENYEIEFMNDSLVKKFGNRIGEKCYKAFIGRSEPCETCPIIELLHKGNLTPMRYQATDKDGNSYDLIASPIKNPDGSISVIEMVRDITDMKQVEEALRESEEEFRLTFENAKDAILWADPETGLITNCNKAAETLLERERHEIIGQHQTMLHSPEKAEYYSNQFKEHIEQKGTVDDEAEIITKPGKIKPVHISASVTLIRGKPVIQGIFRDITERKETEGALQESEERYRFLFEQSPIGIGLSSFDGKAVSTNKAMEDITGYSIEEFKKINIASTYENPEDRKVLFEAIKRDGVVSNFHVRLKRKDGTPYDALLNISPVHLDGKDLFQTMCIDITERKKAEDQIKYLNELKRSVIDNAPFGILTSDKEGNIIHANPALIKILGSPSEEKTKSLNLFKLAAIKKAGLDKVFKKILMEGKEFDLEKEYVSHWGKRIFARLKAFPLRDINEEVTGLVAIIEDVTEKKNLEAKIAPVPEPLVIPEARSISP